MENQTTLLETEKNKFRDEINIIESRYNVKIVFAYVRGSQMYGTSTPTSDVDISFIYVQPTDEILKKNYIETINYDGKSNITGYEIQKYIEMLCVNNPNILESLDVPEDCIIYKDDMMNHFKQEDWVSMLCSNSILGYAKEQIKKATGLNKKINNPQPKKRKTILDFCYVTEGVKSIPFNDWLKTYINKNPNKSPSEIDINNWGLVKIPNGKGLFALIPNKKDDNFRGLIKSDTSTQLRTTTIPKERELDEIYQLWYNLDGFESHCKTHREYWKWVDERNEDRFNTNSKHGKNYDSKNMMHLFRLLEMAEKLAIHNKIYCRSGNIERLLEIKDGKHEYDELMKNAEHQFNHIMSLFSVSDLKKTPDEEKGKNLLLLFRKNYWRYTSNENVCESCLTMSISDPDCVCTYQNNYPTKLIDITFCGCCDSEIY